MSAAIARGRNGKVSWSVCLWFSITTCLSLESLDVKLDFVKITSFCVLIVWHININI